MIGYVKGEFKKEASVVITGFGVGYAINYAGTTPPDDGAEVELWVHTAVRENDITLWGFDSTSSMRLFVSLTKISGVGPAVAAAVLCTLTIPEICSLDDSLLIKAPKVGPKLAKKISSELTIPDDITKEHTPVVNSEKIQAVKSSLTNLGYSKASIDEALISLDINEDEDVSTIVRTVLVKLGR